MGDDALAEAIAEIRNRWKIQNVDHRPFEFFLADAVRNCALEAHGVLIVEEIKDGVMRAPLYRRVTE